MALAHKPILEPRKLWQKLFECDYHAISFFPFFLFGDIRFDLVTGCQHIGKKQRNDIEINDWEENCWIGGLVSLSQEYKCPPMASSGSNIADCILSNEPLMQIEGGNANIFGSLEVKNGFWAWSESGRAENWTCHQNQRMEPADKGDEILPINHPQFLSDRNFISFPVYCKTCMRK